MKEAPKPHDEALRLATLENLQILDTDAEQGFDDLTKLASVMCDTPISLVLFFKLIGIKLVESSTDAPTIFITSPIRFFMV